MVLVCPQKGIYKDGHERADTKIVRGEFGAYLRSTRDRERTYSGDRLEIEAAPVNDILAEIIRVYHDECIFASHEGTLMMWVHEGAQATYRKPRGHVLMASGFICRCHGMMQVPANEVLSFFVWLEVLHGRSFSLADFPMSSKVYKKKDGRDTAAEKGSLCSFTTICPGKGKDDYWVCDDVCTHVQEVGFIFQCVHKRPEGTPPPIALFIFDGGLRADNTTSFKQTTYHEKFWPAKYRVFGVLLKNHPSEES